MNERFALPLAGFLAVVVIGTLVVSLILMAGQAREEVRYQPVTPETAAAIQAQEERERERDRSQRAVEQEEARYQKTRRKRLEQEEQIRHAEFLIDRMYGR